MYFKRRESEFRKAEKDRQKNTIFKNYGGGIYRIENMNSHKIIKDIAVSYFLNDPILNLFDGIREKTLKYFEKENIKWWKVLIKDLKKKERAYEVTPDNMPSREMVSSQIACLNYLFLLREDKESVKIIAKNIDIDFVDVLQIDTDNFFPAYIQFEAVSEIDHLNEVTIPKTKPPRGEYSTSIDALIYALHKSGEKYLIPIEWKYTEEYEYSYAPIDKSIGDSGKERLKRYSELINKSLFLKSLPSYLNSIYFYEPFYQLMRQTLWAEQMIKNKDYEKIKADNYVHVHVVPNDNKELLEIKYKVTGKNMKESWIENLKNKEKYKIITPMELINGIDKVKYSNLIEYITERYYNNI